VLATSFRPFGLVGSVVRQADVLGMAMIFLCTPKAKEVEPV
jgi:hypothetical protein